MLLRLDTDLLPTRTLRDDTDGAKGRRVEVPSDLFEQYLIMLSQWEALQEKLANLPSVPPA